jgi:hypothetical protein
MRVRESGVRVLVELDRSELTALNNALNEVMHGPDAIDEREFFTRIGMDGADGRHLLHQLGDALARPQ